MKASAIPQLRQIHWLLAGCWLLLLAGAWAFYRNEAAHEEVQARRELEAIADSKLRQVLHWRRPWMWDAQFLSRAAFVKKDVDRFLQAPEAPGPREAILDWMKLLLVDGHCEHITLFDANGTARLTLPPQTAPSEPALLSDVRIAATNRSVMTPLLHRGQTPKDVHVDFLVPVWGAEGPGTPTAAAVVALRSAPDKFLYTLMRSWPEHSGETLLITHENGRLFFASPLRFATNAPLALSFPLEDATLDAAAALRAGRTGPMAGIDYRGAPVFATFRKLPDSNWWLEVKMDQAEVASPFRGAALAIGATTLGLGLAAVGGLGWFWHKREAEFLRRLNAELERRVAERTQALSAEVAERQEREAQLRRLWHAVEHSPAAVVITDRTATIEYVNPCFERETGYGADEVIGRNPRLLRSGIHPPEFYASMWECLTAGRTWRGEICNQRKDGSRYWGAAAIAPVGDPSGRITHYVAIQQDITEHRRVAEELRQAVETTEAANRAKSVFLANMSHEIRTPLNAVLGFTQLLLRDPDVSARQRQRLTAIGRSGEHLLNIINDIVEMARIESGRLTLNPSVFSPEALVHDLESMFILRAQQQQLTYTAVTEPGLPAHLEADETKLRQVLINLLGNAFKFTPAGGTVSLHLRSSSPTPAGHVQLHFEVADSGPGVAADESERIFEPFYQTRTGQAAGGTGLGLPISRQIARHMGGDLTLEANPGPGCRFVFTASADIPGHLPPPPAALNAPALVLAPASHGCPVLVVDDVAENREVLAALLTTVGFAVHTAASGREAIDACAAALPRLVVLDLRMPELDGVAVARALRDRHGPAARILVLSASVDRDARLEAIAAGADAFMGKPFRDTLLLECIRELTGVEYTSRTTPPPVPPGNLTLTREAIGRLPAGIREALRHAVAAANHGELLALADQIAASDATIGAQLRSLAERFDDETLHHLLNPDSPAL